MRILIFEVHSIHVSREGGTGETAGCGQSLVGVHKPSWDTESPRCDGEGAPCSTDLLPAQIGISVSKQLTV